MRLILLTLALVLFLLGASPSYPPIEAWRVRLVALGLACYTAAGYPWP
jgi:hypothetical protein